MLTKTVLTVLILFDTTRGMRSPAGTSADDGPAEIWGKKCGVSTDPGRRLEILHWDGDGIEGGSRLFACSTIV